MMSVENKKMLLPFPFNIPLFVFFIFIDYFFYFLSYLLNSAARFNILTIPSKITEKLS